MNDLISRQAAIDALEWKRAGKAAIDAIKNLPSAQHDAVEVVRCKDCKWYGDIGCAIRIFDDTYKPSEHDHCSFAERREE